MKSLCLVVLVVLPAIVLTSNVKTAGRPANLGYGSQQTGINQGGSQQRPGAVNAGYGTQGNIGSNGGFGNNQGPVRTPGFQGSNTGYGSNQGPVRNGGIQGSNTGRQQTLPGVVGPNHQGRLDPVRPGQGFGGQTNQGGFGGQTNQGGYGGGRQGSQVGFGSQGGLGSQGGFGSQGRVEPQTKPLRPEGGAGYGRQQALPAQTNYKG